jgi:rod shape-determining protein MreD
VAAVRWVAGLALAVLVHFLGARMWPHFTQVVDVFLVAVSLGALSGNSLVGLLAGLLVGLTQDTLTPGLYGLYGFADTIVGYSVARLAQRLVIQRATGVFAVVAFASLVQQGVVVGLSLMLLPAPSLPSLYEVGIKAAVCGGLGMLIYAVTNRWTASYESRRRNRMSRLRLG